MFTAPGLTGDADHPCVLLTEDFANDIQIVVNLTAFGNVEGARIDIPAGTALAPGFTAKKRCTVAYGYASREETQVLEDHLGDTRAKLFGPCDPKWLAEFRIELFESEDTPPRVISFCEELDWGLK